MVVAVVVVVVVVAVAGGLLVGNRTAVEGLFTSCNIFYDRVKTRLDINRVRYLGAMGLNIIRGGFSQG